MPMNKRLIFLRETLAIPYCIIDSYLIYINNEII